MIRHEHDCTSPDDSTVYVTTGARGDLLRRCRDCGRFELGATPRPERAATPRTRPQPAAVADAGTVWHFDTCPDPTRAPVTFTGRLGDLLSGCPLCHAFKVLQKKDTPPPAPPEPVEMPEAVEMPEPPTPTEPASRYVCSEHLRRVNWRGRGCNECARRLSSTRAERRRARASQQ